MRWKGWWSKPEDEDEAEEDEENEEEDEDEDEDALIPAPAPASAPPLRCCRWPRKPELVVKSECAGPAPDGTSLWRCRGCPGRSCDRSGSSVKYRGARKKRSSSSELLLLLLLLLLESAEVHDDDDDDDDDAGADDAEAQVEGDDAGGAHHHDVPPPAPVPLTLALALALALEMALALPPPLLAVGTRSGQSMTSVPPVAKRSFMVVAVWPLPHDDESSDEADAAAATASETTVDSPPIAEDMAAGVDEEVSGAAEDEDEERPWRGGLTAVTRRTLGLSSWGEKTTRKRSCRDESGLTTSPTRAPPQTPTPRSSPRKSKRMSVGTCRQTPVRPSQGRARYSRRCDGRRSSWRRYSTQATACLRSQDSRASLAPPDPAEAMLRATVE
jgi:hypothetical protein